MSEKSCKDCCHFTSIISGMYEDYCLMRCFTIEEPTRIAKACSDYTLKEMNKKDPVNPNHYKQGKIECIDAIESATVNKTGLEAVCVANIVKYLWRYEDKGGLEDVRKGKWYYERLLEILENKNTD